MDCYDTDEQLTDFERGVIVGACLAGTPRAKAIELAKEASRLTPVFKVIAAAFENIVTANKLVNTSQKGVLIYIVSGCEQDQASGVTVTEDVVTVFNEMKVRKAQAGEEGRRKKAVLFCLSKEEDSIVLEEGREILQGDVGTTVQDPYLHFVQMLPPDDCRYALYNASYETRRVQKEDLVFIFWDPESAPLKAKMIYERSKDALTKMFKGIKLEWRVNSMEEIQDRCSLAKKLGGRSVVSLEGSPV